MAEQMLDLFERNPGAISSTTKPVPASARALRFERALTLDALNDKARQNLDDLD